MAVSQAKPVAYSVGPSFDFIPALDGLRALSIALVVIAHCGLLRQVPGLLGVTIFFFVSGFLITRQLLAEQMAQGQIALGRFYLRRGLRLYPALLVNIAIGALAYSLLGGHLLVTDVLAAVFYASNYYGLLFDGFKSTLATQQHPFDVLWSLAVEEHFYFVFPCAALIFGRGRARFLLGILAAIVAVTAWRWHLASACVAAGDCAGSDAEWWILHATDARIDSILYGALLAVLLGSGAAGPVLKLVQTRAAMAAGVILLLASLAVRDEWFRGALRFSVQGVALMLVVGSLLFSPHFGWARSVLTLPPIQRIGRWSYSLYLWHWTLLMILAAELPPALQANILQGGFSVGNWLLVALPFIAASIAAAALSYHFVERPMLALRRRFGSHAARERGEAGNRGMPATEIPVEAPLPR